MEDVLGISGIAAALRGGDERVNLSAFAASSTGAPDSIASWVV
jgi:hypothetical protein